MADVLEFEVGQAERHTVRFTYERFSGRTKIAVDGFLVDTDRESFSIALIRRHEFEVGQVERHAVVIEKKRKMVLAPLRRSTYHVFVDRRLLLTRKM